MPENSAKSRIISPEVQKEFSRLSNQLDKFGDILEQYRQTLASRGEAFDVTLSPNLKLIRQSVENAQNSIDQGNEAAAHRNLAAAEERSKRIHRGLNHHENSLTARGNRAVSQQKANSRRNLDFPINRPFFAK